MGTWTYISNLHLILQTGLRDCGLYANGRNAVQLVVTFTPLDENRTPMNLPSIKWGDQARLIDYVTASELAYEGSSGWTYTDNSDQPYNAVPPPPTMSAVTDETHDQTASPASGGGEGVAVAGSQYYAWVSCYPDAEATKTMGVRIETDAGKVYYSALYPQADQEAEVNEKVTISPLTAITFDRTSTGLDIEYGVADDGETWAQDNYYFYIEQRDQNNHEITRVDYVDSPTMFMAPEFSYCGGMNSSYLMYHLCWHIGPVPSDTTFPDVNVTLGSINSRGPNVMTFTVLAHTASPSYSWSYNTSFTIYDQYGNKGDFHPTSSSDYAQLDIKDGHSN